MTIHHLRIPLAAPFASANETLTERRTALIEVTAVVDGQTVTGWGECVALPEPLYSAEYLDGELAVLRDHLVPRLAGGRLGEVAGHRMAKAAISMALLDAALRATGDSLASHLGATRRHVPGGAVVGLERDRDRLFDVVATYVEAGYRRIKMKIEPGWDQEPVAWVRATFGDGLTIDVDANGSYTADTVGRLSVLGKFGVSVVEQPLAADDLIGHAEAARRISLPICLDESIVSVEAARTAIELGAAQVLNIKPGRLGGLDEAARVHDLAVAAGVPMWIGGMLETGIGRAANLALAALPGFTLTGDLSASNRYYATDITDPHLLDPSTGTIAVPDGPGIGVEPIVDVLERFTVGVERLVVGTD